MTGKRIAVAGSFGFHNTGDDAILQSWLHYLSVTSPETEVVVLGGSASAIKQQFQVEAIDWSDWPGMIDLMPSIDLLLIGGGGLFHDYWAMTPETFLMQPSVTGPSYYISLIYLARLFGKPCVLSGVGVGPLETAIGREYTRYAFEAAARASVRDQGSLDCLQETGVSNRHIDVTADPVFGLPISSIPLNQWEEWIGCVPRGPIFGITVRNWDIGIDSERWMNELAAALDEVLDKTGGTTVFIPFQAYPEHAYTDDPSSAIQVRARMKLATRAHIINHYLQPDIAEAIIASCDLVVGMRLHSIVMAMRRGIPLVALAYDPKVANAMNEAGLSDYSLKLEALNSRDLVQSIERSLRDRETLTLNTLAYAQGAFDRSQENIHSVLEVLNAAQPAPDLLPPPLQQWATSILKEHSRLGAELQDTREVSEKEIQTHLDSIQTHLDSNQRLEKDIEWHARREQQLYESADRLRLQVDGFHQTEQKLQQIKFQVRHPLTTSYKLLRRTAGSVARKLIKRNQRNQRNKRQVLTANRAGSLKAVAESPTDQALPRRVCIVAPAFFDMEGKVPYFGGAERYLYELAPIIRELGYQPEIYQPAKGDWIRYFRDLEIRGLDTGGKIGDMNRVFHKRVAQPYLTIYLAFFLAAPECFQPSIGISHGIYWDSEFFHGTPHRLQETVQEVIDCFENLRTVVSVDTNTINWVRTISSSLAEKFHYVPNFVDLSQFRPRPDDFEHAPDEVVIVFPRRLYKARGFWLLTEVIPQILSRHPRAVFHVIGQADSEAEREFMEKALSDYLGRVRWDILPPDQMHKAYWAGDISIIPTLYAEGTSLSCLEAMASGNAVIATDVGGLPNLILHRYNGLLIRPVGGDLFEALDLLIGDTKLRNDLARRALETAQVFSLEDWKAKWLKLLSACLPQLPPRTVRKVQRPPRTVIVENPSLEWSRMKQRPQYLAEQFAQAGWEVFWRQPVKGPESTLPHLHFVSTDEPVFVDSPFLYIFYPYDFECIANYRSPIVIYDVLDDISIHDASDERLGIAPGKRARDYHEKLLQRADLVTTSSRVLFEQLIKIRSDTMLVPNGVDSSRFDGEKLIDGLPADLSHIAGPRIGFHGAFAEWVDVDLIDNLVGACPEYQFVFAGPVPKGGTNGMTKSPNCHFLGEKPPDEIPRFLEAMDVSIVPFVKNATTAGARPLKVLESLAMHRPVVASPLPELEGWPYVFPAIDARGFQEGIKQALKASEKMRGDLDLTEFLQSNSWQENVRRLVFRMNRVVLQRTKGRGPGMLLKN